MSGGNTKEKWFVGIDEVYKIVEHHDGMVIVEVYTDEHSPFVLPSCRRLFGVSALSGYTIYDSHHEASNALRHRKLAEQARTSHSKHH